MPPPKMKNTNQNPNLNDAFFICIKNEFIKINPQDVFMIEGMDDDIVVHTINEKHKVHFTLKSIINQLPANDFIRVHNSYIVRLDKITLIKMGSCIVNKKVVPISRRLQKPLLSRIKIIGKKDCSSLPEKLDKIKMMDQFVLQ